MNSKEPTATRIRSLLTPIIKAEINHLLHDIGPFVNSDGDGDPGWRCQEHAYCTYLLLNSIKENARLVHGDYLLIPKRRPGRDPVSMSSLIAPERYGHWWNRISDCEPIDLSLHSKLPIGRGQIINVCHVAPVVGVGRSGEFTIEVRGRPAAAHRGAFANEQMEAFIAEVGDGPYEARLYYYSSRELELPFDEMVKNPRRMVPHRNGESMLDEFGPDILSALALHLREVANKQSKPLSRRTKRQHALASIQKRYPKARDQLLALAKW